MKLFSFFACVIALGLGTASTFSGNQQPSVLDASGSAGQTTDGAFRDGLYLGKLTAQRGTEFHVASARWATDKDRASFTAGYRQGYSQFQANGTAAVSR